MVLKGDDLLAVVAPRGPFVLDPVTQQTLEPEAEGHWLGGERGDADLPRADPTAPAARPGKEGQDGAGKAALVAVLEVIRPRIVEVDRALDEAKPQDPGVEVEIPLRVAADGRDVMNAKHRVAHHPGYRFVGERRDRVRPAIFSRPYATRTGTEPAGSVQYQTRSVLTDSTG